MRGGGEPPRQMMNATGAAGRPGRRARPKAETKGGGAGGFSPPAGRVGGPGGVRGGGEPPRPNNNCYCYNCYCYNCYCYNNNNIQI